MCSKLASNVYMCMVLMHSILTLLNIQNAKDIRKHQLIIRLIIYFYLTLKCEVLVSYDPTPAVCTHTHTYINTFHTHTSNGK